MHKQKDSTQGFDDVIDSYLSGLLDTRDGSLELEVRFGTGKHTEQITKIEFDNVVKVLVSSGFSLEKMDDYILKISSETVEKDESMISNIRTEIYGLHDIQQYCKTNTLNGVNAMFIQKLPYSDGKRISHVNYEDFGFKVSLQKEKQFTESSTSAKVLTTNWKKNRKTFRYMNRSTLYNPLFPFKIDMSIVKESRRDHESKEKRMIPTLTFAESHVNETNCKYEIEIEAKNDLIGQGTPFNTTSKIANAMRACIKIIMSGLQFTNYPVGLKERNDILGDYLTLLNKDEQTKLNPKCFIGPSSFTLRLENLCPTQENCLAPNVRKNYTITDKADGVRKLLMVSPLGKIYLIDTNMQVQFTGAVTRNQKVFNTLLDGEHILQDKNGRYINLFAAFDVYYIMKKDVRGLHFAPESLEGVATNFRLPLLVEVIADLKPASVLKTATTAPIRIECKRFKQTNESQTIFRCCASLMSQMERIEYKTDGIIFTPANAPVGGDPGSEVTGPTSRITWQHSFKWKPIEANTIDFLVTINKDTNGNPKTTRIYKDGVDMTKNDQIIQYGTLTLRVGFDEKKHGYINPCEDVIQGKLPKSGSGQENSYKPVPFYPTNPSDPEAHICNIVYKTDSFSARNVMMTHENEVIEDGSIVEFGYDITEPDKRFRWKPIRMRYDKTKEYRSGQKNYGNAYHVANSNWQSIHSPVTERMLTTGLDIPELAESDDVYYNNNNHSSISGSTRGLRDFHNLIVKRSLILGASKRGETLIDFAAGKGGDLPKWIHANLSFVFGIDLSKDNIHNQIDGACARYLDYCKRFKIMPAALFVQGNSSLNIRDGTAIYGDKFKQITRAIFGNGPKDKTVLGEGVYRQYGKAENGFNISSCQFAIHYMFDKKENVFNFLRNVCECTRLGGYFIGTTYDGVTIFNLLKKYESGDGIAVYNSGTRVWQVNKAYSQTEFHPDESSIGYGIDVYQDSINKTFREYLVNFEYLTRVLTNFGFELVTTEDAVKYLELPNGSGMFEQLYLQMNEKLKQQSITPVDVGEAPNMKDFEKQISFYNRYFVFKKIRSIENAEQVVKSLLGTSSTFEKQMEALVQGEMEIVEPPQPQPQSTTAPTTEPTTTAATAPTTAPTTEPTTAATAPTTAPSKKKITKIKLVQEQPEVETPLPKKKMGRPPKNDK